LNWREAVVVSLPVSRAGFAARSRGAAAIVFQDCFTAQRRAAPPPLFSSPVYEFVFILKRFQQRY
jgi:hypothetical protein